MARITSDDVDKMVIEGLAKSGGSPTALGQTARQLGYTESWAAELATALKQIRDMDLKKDEMRAIAQHVLHGSGF